MAKTLEAHDKLIREIFEGSYQFEIPDYQRPYAWTTEQAEELFNDLVSAMQDARTSGTTSQYFLGSIVLIKNDREPKSSVVDGQQRLSTLTMLFGVLRAVMPDAADDITDFLYKKGKVSLGETNEYRLIAREEDADFFRTFIQEPGGIARLVASTDKLEDSRLRFRENANLLLDKATALSTAERDALWKFLANDCSLVVISTPDLEAAYRIFSVLNNRGLDLAPIDIIKAAVLGSIRTIAGDAKSRVYAKEWSRIESRLGRDAFGDLFVHIRTIYAKQKQRATLVKEFQDHVTEYKTPIELVDKVIKPYAEVWDFVRDAVFINGLPVMTFELKNSLTKQTVADAITQYQTDRNPSELLFQLGRCVAHMAVDDAEVRFCPHLTGKTSWFLPFNQGWNSGAGNRLHAFCIFAHWTYDLSQAQ